MAGALVGLTLLAAFYSVVSAGVLRAAAGREQAQADVQRQVACSAMATTSARDACLSGMPGRMPAAATASVSFGSPARASAKAVSTASYR